jgi:TolB-like protein/Flp pilus assembly protein TadD
MLDHAARDNVLLQLAAAVDSGTPVDWRTADSTTTDPALQAVVEQLRIVAALAAASRAIQSPGKTTPDATTWPKPPESWGPLLIRGEIGRGRFGTVYRAWDPTLERDVALKILHRPGEAGAVLSEARMLARVRHPNVVTVFGVDQFDDAVGLWMEFVGGLSLKQTLATRGVLGPREAVLVAIDVCRAAAAVHKAGLLHRDIKAHNVMCEAGGRTVLMDFGGGVTRDGLQLSDRTGTPLYLAPELFDGRSATIASDVYSIGVLLYHLVTLRYPVEGDTVDDVVTAHAERRRLPIADVRPDLPTGFVRVVEHALERDPARRYRSAGAMQQDLVAALNLEIAAAPSSGRHEWHRATPSVAVLPFANLGPDLDIAYFCNGLAEELSIGLAKGAGLRVASRTSALRALEECHDARTICRQLKVDTVLEGTVRKAGDRLRITAQLVSAEDGCHLWSEGYDRQISDVLTVQEEIALSVVDRLRITLPTLPFGSVTRRHTENPRAYQYYLQGRFYWSRRYQGGLVTALECFQKAIAEDAGYALAHAGIADVHALRGLYSVQKPHKAFRQALDAATRALDLAPDLSEAHTSLALVKLGNDWDWRGAEREFRLAIELDASQTLPRIYLSWLLVLMADDTAAFTEARTAQELDPVSPLVNAGVAYTFFLARRYDESVVDCERTIELDPNFILAIYVLGMCRAQQGRLPEAIQQLERAAAMSNGAPFYLGLLGNVYARAGEHDKVAALVDQLEALAARRYVPPHCMAYIYAGKNDLDRAIEWEAKAYDDGASPFNYYSPIIENLHGDVRHIAELRRMGARV